MGILPHSWPMQNKANFPGKAAVPPTAIKAGTSGKLALAAATRPGGPTGSVVRNKANFHGRGAWLGIKPVGRARTAPASNAGMGRGEFFSVGRFLC